jgi:hypothetical protein
VTRAGTPDPIVGPAAGAMLPTTSIGGSSWAPALVSALAVSGCCADSSRAVKSNPVDTSALINLINAFPWG